MAADLSDADQDILDFERSLEMLTAGDDMGFDPFQIDTISSSIPGHITTSSTVKAPTNSSQSTHNDDQLHQLRQQLKEIRRTQLEPKGLWSPQVEQLFDKTDWNPLNGDDPTRYIHDPLFWQSHSHRTGMCDQQHSDGQCPMDNQQHSSTLMTQSTEISPSQASSVASPVASPSTTTTQAQQQGQQQTPINTDIPMGDIDTDQSLCGIVRRGDIAQFEAALVAGAHLISRDSGGNTLFHWIALQNRKDMLTLVLNHIKYVPIQELVNLRNDKGETPLYWAVYQGLLPMIQELVNLGADPYIQNNIRSTLLHIAAREGDVQVLEYLKRNFIDYQHPSSAATSSEEAIAAFTLSSPDNNGKTPLHWAGYNGHAVCVAWLLANGANAFVLDNERAYAVHWMAIKGHSECIHIIGEYLSSLTAQDVTHLQNIADLSRSHARLRFSDQTNENDINSNNNTSSHAFDHDDIFSFMGGIPGGSGNPIVGSSCLGISARTLGLEHIGLRQLLHRDITGANVYDLASDKLKKSKGINEQRRWTRALLVTQSFIDRYDQSITMIGLPYFFQNSTHPLYGSFFVLLTFLFYFLSGIVYFLYILPYSFPVLGAGFHVPLILFLIGSLYCWRIAVWGDPGYIHPEGRDDKLYPTIMADLNPSGLPSMFFLTKHMQSYADAVQQYGMDRSNHFESRRSDHNQDQDQDHAVSIAFGSSYDPISSVDNIADGDDDDDDDGEDSSDMNGLTSLLSTSTSSTSTTTTTTGTAAFSSHLGSDQQIQPSLSTKMLSFPSSQTETQYINHLISYTGYYSLRDSYLPALDYFFQHLKGIIAVTGTNTTADAHQKLQRLRSFCQHRAASSICMSCYIERPVRSKHCRQCNQCVHRFDHHCVYLNNCIGQHNYRSFVALICWSFFALIMTNFATIIALRMMVPNQPLLVALFSSPFIVFWLLLSTLFTIVLWGLLQYHISIIAQNLTTYEDMNWYRFLYLQRQPLKPTLDHGPMQRSVPFGLSLSRNIRAFFGLGSKDPWYNAFKTIWFDFYYNIHAGFIDWTPESTFVDDYETVGTSASSSSTSPSHPREKTYKKARYQELDTEFDDFA